MNVNSALHKDGLMTNPVDERLCVCGHDIWEHEDYDFDIHECNHAGCDCKQFMDADEPSQSDTEGESMTDRDAIVILIDALLRKDTERDGNWGYPSFHQELKDLQQRYSLPPSPSTREER